VGLFHCKTGTEVLYVTDANFNPNDRAVAQYVIFPSFTAETRVPSQANSVRSVLKKVALGHDFLWVCRFPLVISFHHLSTHIFIYVLLLPAGQKCDTYKATKQQRLF